MNYPLWSDTNQTLFSSVFNVPAGQVCLLFADQLAAYKVRAEATDILVPQTLCIRRMLHEFNAATGIKSSTCGWIFDIENIRADKIVDSIVQTCGAPWQLTMCKNIGIVGLPGHYRLELNDSTAIGIVQVYAELYSAKDFPEQVNSLFFT